ncbi:MAG: hypothetical protein A2939_02245 [Parcubacteria group bacterium RIFCSPLOWO2_01_FULL_48_18]|nr:MAG: hypothetical protein A2939_02245 [Parcubacteria group bacterium RIFCSPLOWO2_01_FULL_48_18]
MQKTQKSVAKRIKITKRGKLLRRPMGIDHFKTRKTSKALRAKRRSLQIHGADAKAFKKYLPHH